MFSSLKLLGAAALVIAPAMAIAKPDITLTLTRYSEKTVTAADGSSTVVRETALPETKVTPGDPVIYVLAYANKGDQAASNAALVDDLPSEIEYVSTEDSNATVSVDGGKTWGALAGLTVSADGATRAATPADVTHVRWVVAEIAPGASGSVSYRGRVR